MCSGVSKQQKQLRPGSTSCWAGRASGIPSPSPRRRRRTAPWLCDSFSRGPLPDGDFLLVFLKLYRKKWGYPEKKTPASCFAANERAGATSIWKVQVQAVGRNFYLDVVLEILRGGGQGVRLLCESVPKHTHTPTHTHTHTQSNE